MSYKKLYVGHHYCGICIAFLFTWDLTLLSSIYMRSFLTSVTGFIFSLIFNSFLTLTLYVICKWFCHSNPFFIVCQNTGAHSIVISSLAFPKVIHCCCNNFCSVFFAYSMITILQGPPSLCTQFSWGKVPAVYTLSNHFTKLRWRITVRNKKVLAT